VIAVLLADGFETVEALAPVDILRRAGLDVKLVGVTGKNAVSSQGVTVVADIGLSELKMSELEMLFLPGGGIGVDNLRASCVVLELVQTAHREGKWLAAICAAPVLLAEAGLLEGKRTVCYPSMREELKSCGALLSEDETVVRDGKLITGQAAGCSFEFGFALLEALRGRQEAEKIMEAMFWEKQRPVSE